VRALAALVAIAALGALAAFALPRPGQAANPILIATVDDSATITLTDADGDAVTSLPAGTYDIQVHDTTTLHNFHLSGPGVNEATTVAGTTDTVWTGISFSPGSYHFQCDAHAYSMNGDFSVTGATTTTAATTGSTTETTTATAPPPPPPPATTATTPTTPPPPAPPPVRCVVPHVVGLPLTRARVRISRARCRTGRVTRRNGRAKPGTVLAQRPRPGTRLRAGAAVYLTVSR
jgi:hypothetical protein